MTGITVRLDDQRFLQLDYATFLSLFQRE